MKQATSLKWLTSFYDTRTTLITGLGKEDLIFRHTWLHKHNPEINWVTREVKMSQYLTQCYAGFCKEAGEERKIQKAEAHSIAAYQARDLPKLIPDDDEDEDESDLDFKEGD